MKSAGCEVIESRSPDAVLHPAIAVPHPTVRRPPGGMPGVPVFVLAAALCLIRTSLSAADIDAARELFATGKYAECERAAAAAIADGSATEGWQLLKLRALLAVGDHRRALEALDAALGKLPYSIRLRWAGRRAYLGNDRVDRWKAALGEIEDRVRRGPWLYRGPEDRIVVGRLLIERGADARQVLEALYDRLKREQPDFVEAYVASGDLALAKHDYRVAAEEFERALELAPDDPDVLFGAALAHAADDPRRASQHVEAALARNPNHVDSLLFLADGAIDREAYDAAEELIARALAVDPTRSEALAYRAVLAHMAGDFEAENAAREAALATWSTNPGVDHLIGRKLSQKYRFAEGAAYQRRALAFDADHLPAKLQLCQDLLRLGREEEGWRLANEVFDEDAYSVLAHNLDLLHEHLEGFRTLEAEGLVLRMDAREAGVYGARALDLLARARRTLCAKYEVQLREDVVVEIFPEQKDFAIRTFGLPGGAGFLGVCFGNVITANSPASQGESPSNWEAVLWHEFCHAVTLHKTRNRMPRWLSEGISVYEERQADPAWGQSMTPQYLEIIAAGGITPVSRLSGAFLQPPSPLHLQFAYYQSSLVVELIVARHGLDALRAILSDLAGGRTINAVLERRLGPLDALDREVEEFVRSRAGEFASKAEWDQPELDAVAGVEALAAWSREHPRNFWGLQRYALALLSEGRWEEALEPLEALAALCPEYAGPGNAWELLAAAHRERGDGAAEREALEKLAALDGDALRAYLRLMEICAEGRDWEALAGNAERLLAVNPLLPAPHRGLARAMEELGTPERAVQSYRALLSIDVVDPAEIHFRLGRALRLRGELAESKRQLLSALEEAPRFREAHRELLDVVRRIEREAEERSEEGSDGGSEADPAAETTRRRKF